MKKLNKKEPVGGACFYGNRMIVSLYDSGYSSITDVVTALCNKARLKLDRKGSVYHFSIWQEGDYYVSRCHKAVKR